MNTAESESISTRKRYLKWVLIIGAVILVFAALPQLSSPPPSVHLPTDLNTLEPQLKAYIEERAKWVEESPKESYRHATLGTVYAVNGLWNEALLQFDNAATLDPDQPLALLYHAVALQETGELEQSIQQLKLVCRRFPMFPQGFSRLAQAQLKVGEISEAQKAFDRLTFIAPQEWRGHTGLADCLLRQEQPTEALKHLQKSIEIAPHIGITRHLLGLAYQRTGRPEAAEPELAAGAGSVYYPMQDAWSATAPQHFRRLQDQFSVANDYINAGQPDQALPVLLQAAEWHPENISLLTNLARAYLGVGDLNQAQQTLTKLLSIEPKNLSGLVMASEVELNRGDTEKAEQFAKQTVELDPNWPPGHIATANVLLQTGRPKEGYQAYQKAFELDPQNPVLAMELGDVEIRILNRPNEALSTFQKALEINPNLFAIQIRVVDAHIRLGNANEASASLKRARTLSPQDPVLQVLQQRIDALGQN